MFFLFKFILSICALNDVCATITCISHQTSSEVYMAGEGMVAVVRGLRDAGLAVTVLDGNRQYTLLPDTKTAPAAPTQRSQAMNTTAPTQPMPRVMCESSTDSAALQCDRNVQAVDGRYTTMYKTMHCNVRPTSPPVQLTEFPPQRPDICRGHGNFQVGGAGSGAVSPHGKPTSPTSSFRGGLSWPDRGSVCSPRPSYEVDAFANSLRKYPCMTAERSSEVLERLVNYQSKCFPKPPSRNQSPTRMSDSYPCPYQAFESKATYPKSTRAYEPEIVRKKMEDLPLRERERRRDELHDYLRNLRNVEVRCVRDITRRAKDNPFCNPTCPTIKETQDYQPLPQDYLNSSNSVNMEIQAAVKMISKEVATMQREKFARKTVAVPESPTMSGAEDNVEGECDIVRKLDTSMSYKSIQTNFFPSESTLKPRKSAQTIASTLDFQSTRLKPVVSRRSKSQEQMKITKEELKRSLLELIEEVSKTSKCKKLIRDELITKLFESTGTERITKDDRRYKKREQCHKYASTFCPTICDYVGDYHELLGQLKHCYGDNHQYLQTEVPSFRISEYRQLDFVLKDWLNNLNIKNMDRDYLDRRELLNSLEDRIKILFKNRTKQDFDLKSAIVGIIDETPIEVNKSYNRADYLHRLVEILMKRMKNVIISQQYGRSRKKSYYKLKKVLTEADIREFIRRHLLDFYNEYSLKICDQTLVDLENELLEVIIDTIDCIRCGHVEDARDEMSLIFQELANLTEKQAKYIVSMILRDLQEMVNHCNFNHTYMVLNMNNNSDPSKRNYQNQNVERINSTEYRENLDQYAKQLCQQINQWLDTLEIDIHDEGVREVVVNDLAGDMIDRLKYLELNKTIKHGEEDDLEALKYQIFKWINKLVGDDNQETIGNARLLLDKIRSVPVPVLVHPRVQGPKAQGPKSQEPKDRKSMGQGRYTIVECPNPECYGDPMRPCLGETGPGTCSEINRILRPPKRLPVELCCDRETCPKVIERKAMKCQSKSHPLSQDCYCHDPQQVQSQPQPPSQQPHTFADAYKSPQDQSGAGERYQQTQKGQHQSSDVDQQQSPKFPSSYQSPENKDTACVKYPEGQQGLGKKLPYNQEKGFGLDEQLPQMFPSSFQPVDSKQSQGGTKNKYSSAPGSQKSLGTQFPDDKNQRFGLGQTSRPSGAGAGPSGKSSSPQGAQTSVPIAPGAARPTPLPSIKKIYEDYDAYLKDWVQRVPMPMNTPSEKEAADKARLDLYNGVWKTITKMKLDPKIFGNPLYFEEVFNEEIENLMKKLPKSKELEIEKPALKAELLQKTLEMNNLIRSLNASGTYKQQVIECIENNSPRRPLLANEMDQQNEEIEKHSVADYYILHKRYKDDDNVKATFHKKNFLKSLDDYLERIKKRHGFTGMDTYAYANEIINCLDKIPIPNLLALRDEADEILLGMEVENWIADLPLNPDITGPLDKRRTRDSIVKKIEDLETKVNCYENAFGDHLKAELPKYIERIPLKDNTNINFQIDDLLNRIRNLENIKSMRPRSVSFGEPRRYEDFSRDVPQTSSYHQTPGQSDPYYAGGMSNAVDPRSWAANNAPPPLDNEWQSMQLTRAPNELRDWSQNTGQVVAPPSPFSSAVPGQFPPGQGYYNPNLILPQQQPIIQNNYPPNVQEQFDPNNESDACLGPCCLNPRCVNKFQDPYIRPMQYSQPSTSPYISAEGYAPGRVTAPEAAISSPLPQSYGQENFNPYSCESNQPISRCRGPVARYYPYQPQNIQELPVPSAPPPTPPPVQPAVISGPQEVANTPPDAPITRYTQETFVAPQERRPSEPHVSKDPIKSTTMKTKSVPSVSSQGRRSLGPYVQTNPTNVKPVTTGQYKPETKINLEKSVEFHPSAVSSQQRPLSGDQTQRKPSYLTPLAKDLGVSRETAVSPQASRHTEAQTQNVPSSYTDRLPEVKTVSQATEFTPQEKQESGSQTQSTPSNNIEMTPAGKQTYQASDAIPPQKRFPEAQRQIIPNIEMIPAGRRAYQPSDVIPQQKRFSESQNQSIPSNIVESIPAGRQWASQPSGSNDIPQQKRFPDSQSRGIPSDNIESTSAGKRAYQPSDVIPQQKYFPDSESQGIPNIEMIPAGRWAYQPSDVIPQQKRFPDSQTQSIPSHNIESLPARKQWASQPSGSDVIPQQKYFPDSQGQGSPNIEMTPASRRSYQASDVIPQQKRFPDSQTQSIPSNNIESTPAGRWASQASDEISQQKRFSDSQTQNILRDNIESTPASRWASQASEKIPQQKRFPDSQTQINLRDNIESTPAARWATQASDEIPQQKRFPDSQTQSILRDNIELTPAGRWASQASDEIPQQNRFPDSQTQNILRDNIELTPAARWATQASDEIPQQKRFPDSQTQNILRDNIESTPAARWATQASDEIPQQKRFPDSQTQNILRDNIESTPAGRQSYQASDVVPQQKRFPDSQTQSILRDNIESTPARKQAYRPTESDGIPQQIYFPDAQSRSIPNDDINLPSEIKRHSQVPAAASRRQVQYSEPQNQGIPQPEPKRAQEPVFPQGRRISKPYASDQDSVIPDIQQYSDVPIVVQEEPEVSPNLNEQEPPSLHSSAPGNIFPSLEQGPQLPYNQGDSIRTSQLPGYKNKVQDDNQAEPIPHILEEPKSDELTFKDAREQDPNYNKQYVSSPEPDDRMPHQDPHLTAVGDTEVSNEQPIPVARSPALQKDYSSPTSQGVSYEPDFLSQPEVIPYDQISPQYIKSSPETGEIIPYIRVIESDQGDPLQTSQIIRYEPIPFSDLVRPESDFVPYSEAIEIEARSPMQVEQYPPNVAYEYIPAPISIEKTRFSIEVPQGAAPPESAATQVPQEIAEEQPGFDKSTESSGIRKSETQSGLICDCAPTEQVAGYVYQRWVCTDQLQDSSPYYVCASGPEGQVCHGPTCCQTCPGAFENQICQTGPGYHEHVCTGTSIEPLCRSGGLRKLLTQPRKSLKKMRGTRRTVEAVPCNRMRDLDDTDTSMDRYNTKSYYKQGITRREKAISEPINRKSKALGNNCNFKMKGIQTAFSNVDIHTTKYCEIRSKSQEELTKITKKREVIKRRDHSRDFDPDMTEWFEIQSDKVKVKLFGDKLKKLADKLKRPGGEEKVRNKIEKYLKQDQFSEGDENKRQLPNIIRSLKKMQFSPLKAENVSVYRMELPKYCSRVKVENIKKVVLNWTKTLNIKKNDFLGRDVKKEDVFKYIVEKLEPIVLDRPHSDSQYKEELKRNINYIVNELPLVPNAHNNEFYLNKITENLVNDIFDIEAKFPSNYIQPTIKEIKEFVRDEISFFLEKSRVAISTKRMAYLEVELIDILLDLINVSDIDEDVIDEVTTLFKETGKLPEYKAKYFTNLLLKDYKEFFFRESFFHVKGNSDRGRPDVYSVFHNVNVIEGAREEKCFDEYTQQLINAINKWISMLTIPINAKNIIEVIARDLANDIVDRHKFILLNPNSKPTYFEELEYLKFLIFKWTNKLLGEENIIILEHAHELMNEIKKIPNPVTVNTCLVNSTFTHDTDGVNDKQYTDSLIEQILKWYQDLPSDLRLAENIDLNKVTRHLIEEIGKGLSKREDGVVDREVEKWVNTVFKNKVNVDKVEQLTNIIKSVPFTKGNKEKDPKLEKVLIRSFEDLIDEWIDTVPIDPKKAGIFTDNKNEIVHDIAVKISKIKTKINTPLEVLEKKLQQELSNCLKKLPLHAKVDGQTFRDKYAEKLVQKLRSCSAEDLLNNTPEPVVNNETFQIEEVLLEWLKRRPFYKSETPEMRKHQEDIVKELGNKLKAGVNKNDSPDENIIDYVRKLDPAQNDDIVQNIACQLKLYLEKCKIIDFNKECTKKDSNLYNNIELWLNTLPLHVADENAFKEQKAQFMESLEQLQKSGCENSVLKKEILVFMNTLPIDSEKKEDTKYMNQKVLKLMEHLKVTPVVINSDIIVADEEIENKPNNEISDIIKEWVNTLSLKSSIYPTEFQSTIDDMTFTINRIILDSKNTEQINEQLLKETVKCLRRLPIESEKNNEIYMTAMAEMLVKSLEKTLPQDKRCPDTNRVTVYALNNTNLSGFGLSNVKDIDVNENSNTYTKQLANQIGEWLDNLHLREMLNDTYKEAAINDLAGDIVDRHKYLELNPNVKEDELEHLKYQIFKWINKLVGEENLKTIRHADDLMRRVKKIPVPMLVRPQDKIQAQSAYSNIQYRRTAAQLFSGAKNNVDTTTSPIEMNPWKHVYLQKFYTKPVEVNSSPYSGINRTNSPTNLSSTSHSYSSSYSQARQPGEGSKEAVYEKYQKIFKDKCNALPIDCSTPENAKLAELAKTAIYNGIIKTFFNLKADPEIENDCGYFELMLEEKIDELLDVLPQTLELINLRHAWKVDILRNAMDMLDHLHSFSDRPSFRQGVRNKFNRKFAKELELEHCFLLQQGFLAEMADAYILQTNYKEKDELKANIYKNRLMKKVDDLVNHLSKEHNAGFRFFNRNQLIDIAMKVLDQVPIPGNDILQEEAEEIQLGDVVEKWYKELPTKPLVNDTDGVLRKRMMDLLAKKLYDIHKRFKDDEPIKEMKMKHEISMFLEKRAQLQDDQDLNINGMVEDLNNRINNRWLKETLDYDEFEKDRPISSTFAQTNNRRVSSSSIETGTSTGPPLQDDGYFIRPGQQMRNISSGPGTSNYIKQEQSRRPSYEPIYTQRPSYANKSPRPNSYAGHLPEGYGAPQNRGNYSIQAPRGSIMKSNYNSNQYVPKRVTLPNAQRPNMSPYQAGTSGQAYIPQHLANNVPTGHGTYRSNQMSSPRVENANQQSQNMGGLQRQNPNILHVPNYQRPSQGTSSSRYGYPGSQGPSSIAGVTAEVSPSGEDDGEYPKCGCLGLFRPRRMCFDQHSEMYHLCPQ